MLQNIIHQLLRFMKKWDFNLLRDIDIFITFNKNFMVLMHI
jgi:hypothetical protein